MKVKVARSCQTLCNPMDYTVHGILQARILEWVAVPFPRGSSQPKDWTQVSCIAGRFFISWATRKAQWHHIKAHIPWKCLVHLSPTLSSESASTVPESSGTFSIRTLVRVWSWLLASNIQSCAIILIWYLDSFLANKGFWVYRRNLSLPTKQNNFLLLDLGAEIKDVKILIYSINDELAYCRNHD